MTQDTLAWRLARFAENLSFNGVPKEVVEKARLTVLDALGNAIANYDVPPCRIAVSLAKELSGGVGSATIWVDGSKARTMDAVLANAVLVDSMLKDESLTGARAHLASEVVSIALAVGEENDSSGADVLTAIVAGYEVAAGLAGKYAVSGPLVDRGFMGNGCFGVLASATVAGKLMGLDREQMKNALSCAANFASGVLQPWEVGSGEWRFLNANIARSGILASMLARSGVRGADDMLEGKNGFLHAFAGLDSPPEGLLDHLGRDFRMMDIHYKPHPTCGNNKLAAIITQMLVVENEISPEQVDIVKVYVHPLSARFPGVSYRGPFRSIDQGLMSGPFAVATMIKDRNLDASSYLSLTDPLVTELAQKVWVEGRAGLAPLEECRVEIATVDGRVFAGDHGMVDPSLTFRNRESALAEFKRMTSSVIGPSKAAQIADQVFALAEVKDIRELTNLLTSQ